MPIAATLVFPAHDSALERGSRTEGIVFTRSRPYHKNDQAWVEQKNGSVVRRFVGYHRLEGSNAVEALARLYSATRLFVNFFQPSFKLKEKIRTTVAKQYVVEKLAAVVDIDPGEAEW